MITRALFLSVSRFAWTHAACELANLWCAQCTLDVNVNCILFAHVARFTNFSSHQSKDREFVTWNDDMAQAVTVTQFDLLGRRVQQGGGNSPVCIPHAAFGILVMCCKGWLHMSAVQKMDPVAILSEDLQTQLGLQQFPGHPDNLWNDCGALKGNTQQSAVQGLRYSGTYNCCCTVPCPECTSMLSSRPAHGTSRCIDGFSLLLQTCIEYLWLQPRAASGY